MAQSKLDFWAELEEAGESAVHVRRATKCYNEVNQKGTWVDEWLLRRHLDQVQRTRAQTEASQAEQLAIAQSAKIAAYSASSLHAN
jgi:hypothetical protein